MNIRNIDIAIILFLVGVQCIFVWVQHIRSLKILFPCILFHVRRKKDDPTHFTFAVALISVRLEREHREKFTGAFGSSESSICIATVLSTAFMSVCSFALSKLLNMPCILPLCIVRFVYPYMNDRTRLVVLKCYYQVPYETKRKQIKRIPKTPLH